MKLPYHIRARDMSIFKPDGKVIIFWLWAENEDKLRELLDKKGFKDIEWIIQEEFRPSQKKPKR